MHTQLGVNVSLSGSDELLELVMSGEEESLPHDRQFRINYAVSTAPKRQFDKRFKKKAKNKLEQVYESNSGQIVRTVPSDNYVLSAIIDELQRRIPGFGQQKDKTPDEVWLLSEQDTFYSQVMNDEFEAITNQRNLSVKVKSIGFLKGIDGNLPDDTDTSEAKAVKSINNLTDLVQMLNQSGVPEQRLFDRRQIDYLQRLAEKLLGEQRKKEFNQRVKAIGILGGDVYDKMLVLEVFRNYFPATNYFTTDLDSAYLYSNYMKSARNLIIGSSFGLSPLPLHDVFGDSGGSEVVFRDSYQTALYHSILKLLWPEQEQSEFQQAFNRDFGIGIYEVGRSRFHRLGTSSESVRNPAFRDKRYS